MYVSKFNDGVIVGTRGKNLTAIILVFQHLCLIMKSINVESGNDNEYMAKRRSVNNNNYLVHSTMETYIKLTLGATMTLM